MGKTLSRREFLVQATMAGTAVATAGALASAARAEPARKRSANERLNIGVVGVAARGGENLKGVAHENIVALCDIDSHRLGQAAEQFPHAKTYDDYRRLIDRKGIDAVIVSTPDHMHAFVAIAALQSGRDVYCEKPLAHSVWEVRQIREWAAKQKAVTQMGTQIHAGDNYRRAVEIVRSGLLGPVERVHVWFDGKPLIFKHVQSEPEPSYVNYDLWCGPAPKRPFSKAHFHYNWRYWWDYGNGMLGDFGCHYMDLPHWALDLRAPLTVVSVGEKGHDGDNDVPVHQRVDYHFPARGSLPPVHLTWYQGTKYRPKEAEEYGQGKGSAILFEGTKGRLLADYGTHKVFAAGDFTPPSPSIPKSIGHHAEFLEAIRTRGETTCNFDYSGALAETVLLGNVSYRLGGKKLEWDDKNLKAVHCPEAEPLLHREYRKGWTL
jgi:predicted dehydrogenase